MLCFDVLQNNYSQNFKIVKFLFSAEIYIRIKSPLNNLKYIKKKNEYIKNCLIK